MKILFLVPYPSDGASNRYRVEQYLPYLKENNFDYTLHPFWSREAFKALYQKGSRLKKAYFFILSTMRRLSDVVCIFRYDIIFIHREVYTLYEIFFENVLRLSKKPVIFDFDDAIFLPSSSPQNTFIERFKSHRAVPRFIKLSSYVIAGNSFLAGYALRLNPNVALIPTSIDTQKYMPLIKKDEPDGKIVIGWVGSVTTIHFLDSLRAVFLALSQKHSNLVFYIIGGNFSVEGLTNFRCKPWSLAQEIQDLRQIDIGIMPMPDNQWTQGKCGFKAILYMSMGIPCVCSRVGANKEIIIEGNNGFLADTDQEWIDKLSGLIADADLRKRIGNQARKIAEERYSVKVNAPKFLRVLNQAYQGK